MKCQEVMTENPSYCLTSDSVMQAARLMKGEHVGPVPVIEDPASKRVAGILTDRDITVKVVAEGRDPNSTPVREVMSTSLVTCKPDDDVDDALEAMKEHQVRRVLVVDDSHSLRGIISQADIATRLDKIKKTGEVVKEISQPGGEF